MANMSVVIGANYGDEGKGRMVDFLSGKDTLVIRFNGGPQAGHTVVTPNGNRHVFHHFGSGTFKGAGTLLSRFFLSNPIAFNEEYDELKKLFSIEPLVYVSYDSPITTPFDMIINQALERSRGKGQGRHGSCGMGINETMKRTIYPDYALYYKDLLHSYLALNKLINILRNYVPFRLKELGLTLTPSEIGIMSNPELLNNFMEDIKIFVNRVIPLTHGLDSFHKNHYLIFEGAQGLRLDAESPDFPHVTNSRTGMHNVIELIKEAGLTNECVNIHYVTRPYITRHGAGPLRHELKYLGIPYSGVRDLTNITNPNQGSIRYGWFDIQDFLNSIKKDYSTALQLLPKVFPHLVMTCLDQVGSDVVWFNHDLPYRTNVAEFLNIIKSKMAFSGVRSFYSTINDRAVQQDPFPTSL